MMVGSISKRFHGGRTTRPMPPAFTWLKRNIGHSVFLIARARQAGERFNSRGAGAKENGAAHEPRHLNQKFIR